MNYITNFTHSRATLIGSSDIVACLQHPEKHESLAGYERTAITVYKEKRGELPRTPAGLPADIGHELELLALQKAIEQIETVNGETPENIRSLINRFRRGYQLAEINTTIEYDADGNESLTYHNAKEFQNVDWLHHTEAITQDSVSHADCINIADPENAIIIEAKVATSSWSAKRGDDPYKGYDFELEGVRAVPLRHYMQVEHQCAVYAQCYGIKIKRAYLALICDGKFYLFEWRPDVKIQERLLELSSYMKLCIDTATLPVKLAMNADDIKTIYPKINEDFRVVSGEQLETAMQYARVAKDAAVMKKNWEEKERDAKDALAVLLADSGRLRGIVDGEMVELVAWQERKGIERLMPLSEIKKDKRLFSYCEKNGLIKQGEPSKFVQVKFKE